MNKRGMAGRALTILSASAVIALFFFIFIFVLDIGSPDESVSIRENMGGLSKEGQLRLIISQSADDLVQSNPGKVPEMIKEVFGPETKYALYVNNKLIAGEQVKAKTSIETILPTYAGGLVSVKLEVAG